MSTDYFTNRQDRYVYFKSIPSLSAYFNDLTTTVGDVSRHAMLLKPQSNAGPSPALDEQNKNLLVLF